MVDGLSSLKRPFLDVLLQQIENADKLDVFVGKPFFETKPGRIVGVPSFG